MVDVLDREASQTRDLSGRKGRDPDAHPTTPKPGVLGAPIRAARLGPSPRKVRALRMTREELWNPTPCAENAQGVGHPSVGEGSGRLEEGGE
jgi:hypothetical protein